LNKQEHLIHMCPILSSQPPTLQKELGSERTAKHFDRENIQL